MEEDKLVSVIIPTYNRSAKCLVAVLSVLNQSYSNTEILVVDDGSNDNTKDLVCGVDRRVNYVWQKNAGVSAARNTGINMAKGDYIAFLDSDDVWLPWKLDLQLRAFEHFPQVGMMWTDMTAVDENKNIIHEKYIRKMYKSYEYFDFDKNFNDAKAIRDIWSECPVSFGIRKCYVGNIFSHMFMGNLVHTSTVLIRRDRLKKVGNFDEKLLKSGEDYDFHFRTCQFGDVGFLDIPTIHYMIGAQDQLTNKTYMIWMARNDLKTLSKILEIAGDEIKLPDSLIRTRMAYCYSWNGVEEISQNSHLARKYFIKSLAYKPLQLKTILMVLLSLLPISSIKIIRQIRHLIKFK